MQTAAALILLIGLPVALFFLCFGVMWIFWRRSTEKVLVAFSLSFLISFSVLIFGGEPLAILWWAFWEGLSAAGVNRLLKWRASALS